MRMKSVSVLFLFISVGTVFAQSEEKPSIGVVELGAVTSQDLAGGQTGFGSSAAFEATPIENWLKVEAGVASVSAVILPSGAPIFCSKSLGPCREPLSLWWVSGRNGFTQANTEYARIP